MTSNAATVDEYLEQAPDSRSGPTYKKDTGIEIGWASQKGYIGFYCMAQEVMLANKELLQGIDDGKGVIRFRPGKVDISLARKILNDTLLSEHKPC